MEDDMDEYFMISMLLEGSQTMKTIDNETTKLSSDKFDVFIKNDHVVMVIDKRKDLYNVYNDIKTAYDKIIAL